MTLIAAGPVPQIPTCKIRGRLIPTYDFLPRLKRLCLSLGFNDPKVIKSGRLAPPHEGAESLAGSAAPGSDGRIQGPDAIVVLSTKVFYEQNWGGYSGLSEQYQREKSGRQANETPADFILPYLQQYHQAQMQIHLGVEPSGRILITLPESLVKNDKPSQACKLRIKIETIAEPNINGGYEPLQIAGSFVTFAVTSRFKQALDGGDFPWKRGVAMPIGGHLSPEVFDFIEPNESAAEGNSFAPLLGPVMPWIVVHKTPHLAATLVHLQHNFAGERQMFAATGDNDLRNLLCVAGLDIDMKGFRGRKESYFVPWQACWKRQGYCYSDIYPLLQDDLFVALMNCRREDLSLQVDE